MTNGPPAHDARFRFTTGLRIRVRARIRFLACLFFLLHIGCGESDVRDRASGNPGAPASAPNVLLIVLDTVRADRLGCYGYERPLTPHIDAFAEDGTRFTRCFANSSWTLPSHASVFTGQYPIRHRATQETLALDERLPVLAEIFHAAGYAVAGASSNPVVSVSSGLSRGFPEFHEVFRPQVRRRFLEEDRHANNVVTERFLETLPPEQPFFVFLNYIEAHLPYRPPERLIERFVDAPEDPRLLETVQSVQMRRHYLQEGGLPESWLDLLSQLYDAEIAYLDEQFGDLLAVLERSGRAEETLVVLTSDHGENLGEHGHVGHVFSVHNTLLQVPLILRRPAEWDRNPSGFRASRAGTPERSPTGTPETSPTGSPETSRAGTPETSRADAKSPATPPAHSSTPSRADASVPATSHGSAGGSVRDDLCELLDLYPTLLALHPALRDEAERRGGTAVPGRDLLAGESMTEGETVLAEYYYPRQVLSVFGEADLRQHPAKFAPYLRRLRAVQDGRDKLIWSSNGEFETYRVATDSAELENRMDAPGARPDAERLLRSLRDLVREHEGTPALPPPPEPGEFLPGFEAAGPDAETRESLRSLGYIR